jgi:NAD(P)-dependent dehydrogenase (short-subunit alcohol dehydrogenase family)
MPEKTKVVVVIGGTGQIGTSVASGFLERGYSVVSVARGRTAAPQDESRPKEKQIETIHADVRIENEVKECFEYINRIFGPLNCVVYSPGIEPDVDLPLLEYPLEAWENTFRVYVTGLFLCFRTALPYFEPSGHFFVLSSAITRFSMDNLPPLHAGHYAAAKAAVDEFCKWARRESHTRGCLLSRLAPAAVDVPFHRNAPANRRPARMIPLSQVVQKITAAALERCEIDEMFL